MKRKYKNEKVKVGDWVYIKDRDYNYESVCKYKVIGFDKRKIIVEVKNNKEDSSIILGWATDDRLYTKEQYNLPSGTKAWNVFLWKKAGVKCLSIE